MTAEINGAATGASRRVHIEALLASYPNLADDELDTLKNWFDREASALDVAMLASNGELGSGYKRFRADHIDRFKSKDIVVGIVVAFAAAGLIVSIALLT